MNFENGKIIFSDELDKYFVATPTKSGATEITFHCNDPFKYSVTERELKSSEGKFSFTNNGSVSCPIRYEFKTDADLGYIAIASKSGAMEYGDPKELDKEETTGPEKVLSWSQFLESPDGEVIPDTQAQILIWIMFLTEKQRYLKPARINHGQMAAIQKEVAGSGRRN